MATSGKRADRRDALTAGVLAAAGYAVAAWNLAGVSWDGSWYLFHSLQDRAPFTPHHRYGTYPLTWLVVRASEFIHDPAALGVIFGWLLALFPLGSLGLSWYFLRRESDHPLWIWPALGILLASLPGQLCLISEATPAAQLLWPMLAIIANGPRNVPEGVCLLGLGVLAALLHPSTVLILAFIAVLLAWRGWKMPGVARGSAFFWAAACALLAVGDFIAAVLSSSDYERTQASFRAVYWQFENSVSGTPLVFLGLLYVLGFALLPSTWKGHFQYALGEIVGRWSPLPGRLSKLWKGRLPAPATGTVALQSEGPPLTIAEISGKLPLALCLTLAVVGAIWAGNIEHWSGLLDYRRFVLPAMVPLALLAVWHYHRLHALDLPGGTSDLPPYILTGIAAVFATVLVIQSFVWGRLVHRFSDEISRRAPQGPYVYASDLPFTNRTPLRHWSAISLSVLLQGRHPRTIYVLHPESIRPGGMEVYPPDDIDFVDGWFALSGLDTPASGKR